MTPEPMSQMRGKLYQSDDSAKAKAVNILRGKINPTNGKVSVDGVDIKDIKK